MSSHIDLKFITKVSSRLSQFKKRGEYLFNFRCPYCGDSQKSKTKARGYLYRKKNDMFFKCHNCSQGTNLGNFIKNIDQKLHDQYVLERYKGSAPSTPTPKEFDFKVKFEETNLLDSCTSVNDLKEGHPVKDYIKQRLIPPEYYGKLYLVNKFHKFANKVKPDTFKEKYEHPRLIIPFFDVSGNMFAFQGRSFGNEQPKYITIKLDESKQKVYGLDTINLQEHVYIVEGPIDSMFIKNCLAAGGADLNLTQVQPSNVTYIFDNEPRNKEIIKNMIDVVDKDYNLMIWPEHIQSKDVNEAIIKKEMSKSEINNWIDSNTFSGLSAMTKINQYKKC